MANYIASFTLADVMGRTTSYRVEVGGTDADDAATNAIAISALLAACTKLGLVSGKMTVPLAVTPTEAVAGSNTDVGGRYRGVSDDDGKVVTLRMPDPIAAIVLENGGLSLVEEHADPYLDSFVTDGDGFVSDGEQVASWLSGSLDVR
jgi:hypothetical protein